MCLAGRCATEKAEEDCMEKLPKISEAEYEVMKIVWEGSPVSTNEITDRLVSDTDWSPKTIQTLIRRLVAKGVLSYEKQGRMFFYTPVVKEEEYLRRKSSSFVDRYFHGDFAALVSAYLDSEGLKKSDVEALKGILAEHEGKN